MKYKELPTFEVLMDILRKTLNTAWHINTIHEAGLKKWLNNFVGDALRTSDFNVDEARDLERRISLFLLCNFVYYNEEEVKHLMKVMIENYIHAYFLKQNKNNVNDSEIDELIRKTTFSPLGNQSESSSYMLYMFRQINDLSKYDFEDKKNSENIVFVDDFSITVTQANRYIKKYLESHPDKINKKISVLLMVSTQDAVQKIESINEVDNVLPCIIMDDSSKVFSDSSIVFQGYSPEIKEKAKKVCQHYGELLLNEEDKKHGATALGFGDGGYLMGAYYNTPNNTLPIFWSDKNSWQPIFQRYNKKYTNNSSVRIGGHYV